MGDELNDDTNITGEFRRKRPVPVPIYEDRYNDRYNNDRYVERPYLKKYEIARIRNNLDELVEIKEELINKNIDKINIDKPNVDKINIDKPNVDKINIDKPNVDKINIDKPNVDKIDNVIDFKKDIKVPTITENVSLPIVDIVKHEIVKDETIKDEIKIGISNLDYNKDIKKIDVIKLDKPINKQIENEQLENKQIINKQNKIKSKKVIRMNGEDNAYNVDMESAFEKFSNKKETDKAIRESADLARQNKIELASLKLELAKENERIKNELKNEFGNKFSDLSSKFNDITGRFENVNGKFENVNGKFDGVTKKLEETCTGIDCLKKDFANISKNMDLFGCENCGEKVVPAYASYCPKCSSKQNWFEDDGVTPLKGWKPTWEK